MYQFKQLFKGKSGDKIFTRNHVLYFVVYSSQESRIDAFEYSSDFSNSVYSRQINSAMLVQKIVIANNYRIFLKSNNDLFVCDLKNNSFNKIVSEKSDNWEFISSEDGRYVCVFCSEKMDQRNNYLKVLDLNNSNDEVFRIESRPDLNSSFYGLITTDCVQFVNNTKLYYVMEDILFVKDLSTNEVVKQISNKIYSPRSMLVHPNERLIAMSNNDSDYSYQNRIFDLKTEAKYFVQFHAERSMPATCFPGEVVQMVDFLDNPPRLFIMLYGVKDRNGLSPSFLGKRNNGIQILVKYLDSHDNVLTNSIFGEKDSSVVILNNGKHVICVSGEQLLISSLSVGSKFHFSTDWLDVNGINLLKTVDQQVLDFLNRPQYSWQNEANTKAIVGGEWLKSAGALSCYITGKNGEKGKNVRWRNRIFPGRLMIGSGNNQNEVVLQEGKGSDKDCIVTFPKGGSYRKIKDFLMPKLVDPTEKSRQEHNFLALCRWQFDKILPNTNQVHAQLARSMLNRINGANYPDGYSAELRHFADCLLTLMIGVEASRNNATFLISIMFLDLVVANRYGFDRAFVSESVGEHWNYGDNSIRLGGVFSMAAEGTGNGNMDRRRALLYDTTPDAALREIKDLFWRHHVVRREIRIIINWLDLLPSPKKAKLWSAKTEDKFTAELRGIIQERMKLAYEAKPAMNSDYLDKCRQGYSPRLLPPLQGYYNDGATCYYLEHTANKTSFDTYFHRTDVACKLVPDVLLNANSPDDNIKKYLDKRKNSKGVLPKTIIRFFKQHCSGIVKENDFSIKSMSQVSPIQCYQIEFHYPKITILYNDPRESIDLNADIVNKIWAVINEAAEELLRRSEIADIGKNQKLLQWIFQQYNEVYKVFLNRDKKVLLTNAVGQFSKLKWNICKSKGNTIVRIDREDIRSCFSGIISGQNSNDEDFLDRVITAIIKCLKDKRGIGSETNSFQKYIKDLCGNHGLTNTIVVENISALEILECFYHKDFSIPVNYHKDFVFRNPQNNQFLQLCPSCYTRAKVGLDFIPFVQDATPVVVDNGKFHNLGGLRGSCIDVRAQNAEIMFAKQAIDKRIDICTNCFCDFSFPPNHRRDNIRFFNNQLSLPDPGQPHKTSANPNASSQLGRNIAQKIRGCKKGDNIFKWVMGCIQRIIFSKAISFRKNEEGQENNLWSLKFQYEQWEKDRAQKIEKYWLEFIGQALSIVHMSLYLDKKYSELTAQQQNSVAVSLREKFEYLYSQDEHFLLLIHADPELNSLHADLVSVINERFDWEQFVTLDVINEYALRIESMAEISLRQMIPQFMLENNLLSDNEVVDVNTNAQPRSARKRKAEDLEKEDPGFSPSTELLIEQKKAEKNSKNSSELPDSQMQDEAVPDCGGLDANSNLAPVTQCSQSFFPVNGVGQARPNDNLEAFMRSRPNFTIDGLEYLEISEEGGNCLYKAVGWYKKELDNMIGDKLHLRTLVAAYLTEHKNEMEQYSPQAKNQTYEQWVEAVRNGSEFADAIEIEVLMRILNQPIIIIGPEGAIRNHNVINRFTGEPIFVYYNGHNHYDVFLVKNGFDARAILNGLISRSTTNQPSMNMSMES